MNQDVNVYCLKSHITGRSAIDLISHPLKPFGLVHLKTWEGRYDEIDRKDVKEILCFLQLPPPAELFTQPNIRVIWMPMWDHARAYDQHWWGNLPKSLKVIAFSHVVAKCAEQGGLQFIRLKFFKNPNNFPCATWEDGRVMFYWNRNGLIGPKQLGRLCKVLQIRKLLFRKQIDPRIPLEAEYTLPCRLGRTNVHLVGPFKSRREYYRMLKKANVFIAPRAYEGVGLTFLEAMASGCAVLGNDAPAMNEYIRHREDGYLLQNSTRKKALHKIKNKIRRRLATLGFVDPECFEFFMPNEQDWLDLGRQDLPTLGSVARQRHREGFEKWNEDIKQYSEFVLDW